MPFAISIVVCTKNRAHSLRRVLDSLQAQTLPPGEIIVIDNGSTDGTREVALANPKVRYISQPQAGLAVCRQEGIAASAADYVVMCDDDCLPEPHWLETICATFERDPQVAVVAGGISNHGFPNNLKGRGRLGPNGLYQLIENPADAQFFGSANMALRKTAIAQIGGYDPQFTRGYEEVDLITRIRRAGFSVRYEPTALVHHHHISSTGKPRFMHRSRQGMRLYFFFKHYWPESARAWGDFALTEASLIFHDLKIGLRGLLRHGLRPAVLSLELYRIAALLLDRALLPRWLILASRARRRVRPSLSSPV